MSDSKILLVTTREVNIEGVDTVRKLKGASRDTYDVVVFNTSEDKEFEVVSTVVEMNKTNGTKFIYVSEELNDLYFGVFRGINASIYDSEDYITDKELLMYLVNDSSSKELVVKDADDYLNVLNKGVKAIVEKDGDEVKDLAENELWLKTLSNAIENVEVSLGRSDNLNKGVVDILNTITGLMRGYEVNNNNTQKELEKVNKIINDMKNNTNMNRIEIFSPYNVPIKHKNVLYIKVYSHCKFLMSFLLAYQHYLNHQKVDSKLLLIVPKLSLMLKKYNHMPMLTLDSINRVKYNEVNNFVTYEPRKVVMEAFFKQNTNLFIVVDMMMGDKLVEGATVTEFNAVSGLRDIEKYNLDKNRVMITMTGHKESIRLPYMKEYATSNEGTRRTLYFDRCKEYYEKLDKTIGV